MEQTSSTAYPNLLVVDYLRSSRRDDPQVMLQAESYLNVGYQKILTFQNRANGGFGWWGGGENPVVWVTAYGVLELNDMSKVMEVDRAAIERAQAWLIAQQGADGTWRNTGGTHGVRIDNMPNQELGLTGYVAWSLAESGYQGAALERALGYLEQHVDEAAQNPYALALIANALVAAKPKASETRRVLGLLDELKQTEGERVFWSAGEDQQTLSYARGDSAAVELTALVAYAMLRSGGYASTVNGALAHLVATRDPAGAWGSTQATILALKALVGGAGGTPQTGTLEVTVRVNGDERVLEITPDQADVLQLLDFGPATQEGANQISLEVEGESSLGYQVISRHYLPWSARPAPPRKTLDLTVDYDRTRLATDDTVRATARLRYTGAVSTYMVVLDLGIPPGFDVAREDLEALVAAGRIETFTLTARQITVYLGGVEPHRPIELGYSLRAKYPVKVKTPTSTAYEYYTPENRDEAEPVALTVE